MEGEHVLYVECLACGHEATLPGVAVKGLWGDALWSRLRCSACGVKGRVETPLSFVMARGRLPKPKR